MSNDTITQGLEQLATHAPEPVLDWYRESYTGVLDIPGLGAVEQVQERILTGLDS